MPPLNRHPVRGAQEFALPRRSYAETTLYSTRGERKYLNLDERARVLAAAAELPPDHALFVLTLAWTGARASEVLALTVSSFQVERGVVAIETLKRRKHHVREVPVPPALMAALDNFFALTRRQREVAGASSYLWPWHRVTAWRRVKRVMRGAGITGVRASPRGLRHGFAVAAIHSGVPLNLLQRWMGHARMSTTAIYLDVFGPEEQVFAARFWNANDNRAPGFLFEAQYDCNRRSL